MRERSESGRRPAVTLDEGSRQEDTSTARLTSSNTVRTAPHHAYEQSGHSHAVAVVLGPRPSGVAGIIHFMSKQNGEAAAADGPAPPTNERRTAAGAFDE